jgi:two-component sensor histidine kinase
MPGNVSVLLDTAPIDLPARTALPMALIVSEFASNSLKHAFPDDRSGAITITGRPEAGGYLLTLSDNGVGARGEEVATGLGMQVIAATAAQIGAEIRDERQPAEGFRLSLSLPAPSCV